MSYILYIALYLLIGAIFCIVTEGVLGKNDIMLGGLIAVSVLWPILVAIYIFVLVEEKLKNVVVFKGEWFRKS
ncbi:MAG: hypothetical protein MI740_10300 [Halanaerobiales bacterium]|nr:hypothetical protein [Halanaerobiales bacterium]